RPAVGAPGAPPGGLGSRGPDDEPAARRPALGRAPGAPRSPVAPVLSRLAGEPRADRARDRHVVRAGGGGRARLRLHARHASGGRARMGADARRALRGAGRRLVSLAHAVLRSRRGLEDRLRLLAGLLPDRAGGARRHPPGEPAARRGRSGVWRGYGDRLSPGHAARDAVTLVGGLRTGLALCVIGVIVGEILGSRAGMGALINHAYGLLRTGDYVALVLVTLTLVVGSDVLASLLEHRARRWTE